MRRTILVLGMHRSGTSCLAGILENTGVDFGKVSTVNEFNRKGNRENKRILKLNDQVMTVNNGSWDNPPIETLWPGDLKEERDRILEEYNESPVWGFKDPRVLFTLEGWLDALRNVSFAGTFRHPAAVAQSLYKRNQFPLGKSLALWKRYNAALLFYHKKYNFPMVSFDSAPADYKDAIEKLLGLLDLRSRTETYAFYDHELRHEENITLADIPEDILDMYGELNRAAIT